MANIFKDQQLKEEHVLQRMRDINALENTADPSGSVATAQAAQITEDHSGNILVAFPTTTYANMGEVQSYAVGNAYLSHMIEFGTTGGSYLNLLSGYPWTPFRVVNSNLYALSYRPNVLTGNDEFKKYTDSGTYVSSYEIPDTKSGGALHTTALQGCIMDESGSPYLYAVRRSFDDGLVKSGVLCKHDSTMTVVATHTITSGEGKDLGGNNLEEYGDYVISLGSNLICVFAQATGYGSSVDGLYLLVYNTSLTYQTTVRITTSSHAVSVQCTQNPGGNSFIVFNDTNNKYYELDASTYALTERSSPQAHDQLSNVYKDTSGNIWATLYNTTSERYAGSNRYLVKMNSSGSELSALRIPSTTNPDGKVVVAQTTFYAYTSGVAKVSLGTPDGGVSVPALTGLSSNSAVISNKHILDMRTAIQALVASNHFKNPSTGVLYNWTNGSANNLYKVAMGDRTAYGASGGAAYDWTRSGAAMVGTPTYDIDIGEVYECIEKLKVATIV